MFIELLQSVIFLTMAVSSHVMWRKYRLDEYLWSTLLFGSALFLNEFRNRFPSLFEEGGNIEGIYLVLWLSLLTLLVFTFFKIIKKNKIL